VSKLLAVAIAVLVGSYLKPALRAKVVARSDLHRTSADSVTASAAKQLKQNTTVSPEKSGIGKFKTAAAWPCDLRGIPFQTFEQRPGISTIISQHETLLG
jgi:hypothetical protein